MLANITPHKTNGNNGKRPRRLSVRLMVVSLFISFIFAIAISVIEIYVVYKQYVSSAVSVFTQVESSYRRSLEAALWQVDAKGVDNLLDAISTLPNVGKVTLIDESKAVITRNNYADPPFAQRDFVLRYSEGNTKFELGTLHIELTNTNIQQQLQSRASSIAITSLLALLGSSIFVLILFHFWISRHLIKIANFTRSVDAATLGSTLTLDRPSHEFEDELDLVVDSFNRMQLSLKAELTAREKIEQELRSHRDTLEALVAERTLAYKSSAEQLAIAATIAELGVWSWNIENDVLLWNDRMFDMYFQPRSLGDTGLKFEHWQQCLHPDDVKDATEKVQATIQTTNPFDTTFRIITPNGDFRHIKARAQVVCDATGKAIVLTGINQDITDQIELQSRLIEARDQADAANAAKSSFLANMSHEIRTPMNAVLGMLQLVQRTALDTRQRDYIVKANSAAKSLLELLNDILDYSKIEADKLVIEKHPFELESLMHDLAVIVSGNQGQKEVEVIFDLSPTLPATLIGDQLRLQQILINLAGNALKFTTHGHIKISVTELSRHTNQIQLRFSVSDTGIGISPEQQRNLFSAFSQAEASTSRRYGGSGLGLVISQRLVSLLGGQLQLSSELGHGSLFWFDLTLGIALDAISQANQQSLFGPHRRILVVDNNPITSEVLARNIEEFGWSARCVGSSGEALEHICAAHQQENWYDVILMSWHMPDVNGVTAARMIHKDGAIEKPPVVIITAAYDGETLADIHKQPDAAFADFLLKPITPLHLMTTIQRALHHTSTLTPTNEHLSSIPEQARRLEGLRLLVVEDNALNRQVAAELLSSEGAQVYLANGGLDGINQLFSSTQDYDAVLMDVQMPDIDGLEATRRIRSDARFANLPILAMTANISVSDQEQCFAAGMNGHTGKPIDLDELVAALLGVLSPSGPEKNSVITPELEATDRTKSAEVETLAAILRRFGGQLGLLRAMLVQFKSEGQIRLEELSMQLTQHQWKSVTVTLHSLKGTAATLGLTALASKAAELEQQSKNHDVMEAVEPFTIDVIETLRHLLNTSLATLEATAEQAETIEEVSVSSPSLSMDAWQIRLAELNNLLATSNMHAIDAAEALMDVTPLPYRNTFEVLLKEVQSLDFIGAKRTMETLLDQKET